jgi:4-amino-4-deoxy-L-arabinose transferase-like glycosyltransferase
MGMAALLLFAGLGSAPIYILDEAKNAQCAREMWHEGNWVYPTFNGNLRTDKPALHYWFMMVSYTVFGEGAAQARFFSAVLGLCVLLITYYQVRRYAGDSVAFFSALTLMLSPHFLFEFRLSVPDPYLIFFTTAGLFYGFRYLHQKSRPSLFICAALLGIAVLAKGPVALALPGLVFLVFMLAEKKWWVLKDPALLVALMIAIGIAFPWYYAVHVQSGGAFTRGFFLDHNLNRFSAEKEGHGGPFIITPLIVLIGLLPFSLLLIQSFKKNYRYWQQPLFKFSAIVLFVYVVFFSVSSTKLPNYPMPCYPFAAVLAGFLLKDIFNGFTKPAKWTWWVWMIVATILPVAAFVGLRAEPAVAHLSWVAGLLLMLPIGTLFAFFGRNHAQTGLIRVAATWLIFSMIFLWVGYPLIYRENPVTRLLPMLKEYPKSVVVSYKAFNPGFNFNLGKDKMLLQEFNDINALKQSGREIEALGAVMYVITRLDYTKEFEASGFRELARERDLFELPTTVILKWEP